MQAKGETPDMQATLEVFRGLGLEKAEARDFFRQLAKPSDWHTWGRRRYGPHDTRNNTRKDDGDSNA